MDTIRPAITGGRAGTFTTTAPTGIVAGGIVTTGITVDTENAVGTLSCCDGSIECRDRRRAIGSRYLSRTGRVIR
jgi:hypothetical protein